MKKLTAGIFTVLIGLCAANSADAAIASKAWVEQGLGTKVDSTTYTTDKSTLESSIATAKQAGDDAAAALGAYKTTNDAAVLANTNAISAINNETTGILKQAKDYTDALANGAVATNTSSIATINQKLESVATTEGLNTLTNTVAGHTTAINTLNGTGEGSVSKSIADAVTALKNGEIKTNADAIDALEGLVGSTSVDSQIDTKIDALNLETTYQTIGNMKNAISEGMTDAEKQATYPTIALLEKQIDSSGQSINLQLSTLTQTVGANKTEAANATAAVAKDLADYETSNNAAVKALQDSIGENGATATAIAAAQADATKALADAATAQAAAEAAQEDANTNAGAITGLQTTVGDASSGLVKGVADNNAAIEAEVTRAKAAEAANATAAANAQSAADAAQATANAAIPKPTGECLNTKNKCVLTFNGTVYTWEVIERATDEVVQ